MDFKLLLLDKRREGGNKQMSRVSAVSPGRFIFSRIVHWAMIASMMACFSMVFVTVIDITSRQFFQYAIPGVFELSETLMVMVVFLGLGLAQQERAHLRAELFISKTPRHIRRYFDLFAHVSGLFFWGAMAIMSFYKAWGSFIVGEYKEGLIKFPVWPVRWFLAFGLLLLFVQLVLDIQDTYRSNRKFTGGKI